MSDNRSSNIRWWAHSVGAGGPPDESERYGFGRYAWAYSNVTLALLLRARGAVLPPGEKDFSDRILEILREIQRSEK